MAGKPNDRKALEVLAALGSSTAQKRLEKIHVRETERARGRYKRKLAQRRGKQVKVKKINLTVRICESKFALDELTRLYAGGRNFGDRRYMYELERVLLPQDWKVWLERRRWKP